MASDNVLERRKRCFEAWKKPSKARKLLPNPRHDHTCYGTAGRFRLLDEAPRDDLEAELAAWEQASDEDFDEYL